MSAKMTNEQFTALMTLVQRISSYLGWLIGKLEAWAVRNKRIKN